MSLAPDLLGAIADLINSVMAIPLGATAASPKAFSSYATAIDYPYAIITNPSETYEYQSPDSVGVIGMLADGQIEVSFYATTLVESRTLGRLAALKLADQDVLFLDGQLLEFRPMMSATTVLYEEGVAVPAVFVRTVTFHYREQIPQS